MSTAEASRLLPSERQQRIRQLALEVGVLRIDDLAERFGVSEMTVRRDLEVLEEAGYVERTFGGAVALDQAAFESSYAVRLQARVAEKEAIARHAATLIQDGDTVAIDASTTALALARELLKRRVTVVTNGLDSVLELRSSQHASVILIGGHLRQVAGSFAGPLALKAMSELRVDQAFISGKGLLVPDGLVDSDLNEAEVKRAMIAGSARTVVDGRLQQVRQARAEPHRRRRRPRPAGHRRRGRPQHPEAARGARRGGPRCRGETVSGSAPQLEPLLRIEDVHKRFGGVYALRGVSFEVRPGEVHALLGENGAGKSTLIKLVAGVHQPDAGSIFLDGQRVEISSPREAQRRGIDTIYQELSLYPELSVAENIFAGRIPQRRLGPLRLIDWPKMFTRSRELLAELDVHELDVKGNVGMLSVGNRQRVEIAKALSLDAKILIMDEPTAALTQADVENLFTIVRLLRERGVGIIYITHRLSEVFELADRVTVLRDGNYIGTKLVNETSERELIGMMVGRTIDNLFPKQEAEVGEVLLEVRELVREPNTRKVSFQVRSGEIVGMAGLVGSGRSETAQVIFGITPAQSGRILIGGREVDISRPSQAIAHGLAYLPEDRGRQGLIQQMTLRENLSLAVLRELASGSFIRRGDERAHAERSIERYGIRAYGPEQVVNKLSGGNQQKVVVGKWLASEPKILIMDEPTRGIDVGAKAEIHRLMSELAAERGLAILMISSELPEILGMSDRVLVMRSGEIVAEYPRGEATQERIAGAMMGERKAVGA